LRHSGALAYNVHSFWSQKSNTEAVAASGPGHPISLHP